jgi:class 3 adenylate cyclase/tetratricopeptide (TPR) repeat protein
MVCSGCGTTNEAGRKFCKECASPLAIPCPACGSANAPDAKFCGDCATGLTATPVRPAATLNANPEPIAERRLVSVLFVDLVGFTPFAEGRDAEEVRDALSRYFDIARAIIERYGGTVEKFIGDAVMAVWGAPVAHEDDAERAVRAALELVDGVTAVGPGISARAGVLTGEAAVTLGATNQGMVAGDLVNTAARLQSVAPAGAVLVGEATQRATSRAIAYEPAGEHELKGKASPVPAWRALRVVAELGGKNRADTLEAPFVGREDELRLLKELFHATGRERRTRLVSIIAPPGLGKSRLAWELSKYIDGLVENVWWHAGRSPAYGQGITFWALGEMIRERAGLAETDAEATTRARIGATVAEWIADADEARWIEGALLALLGVEPMPGGPEQLFAAWRTFFERISAKGTVAVVFEDLHWADPGTLDFIDHLLDWSRGAPLFIVTLARPELFDKRPDWTSGRRNFSSIALDPLPDPAMAELLDGLVPGLPERTVGQIVRRAEGVPLYAVETVRMLVADGKLVRDVDDGAYRPAADLAELAVPETLTALIAARLDGLAPAEHKLVSDAAVLGQSFTPAGLASVAGLTEPETSPLLRNLVRLEILAQAADPRSPERGQYAFVQALIREVAYNTLARRDRRARHLAAARFFESIDNDQLTGAVAGHLLAAFAASTPGPEADAVGGQARIALKAAAERAAGLGAHIQAVAFLEQAMTVTRDPAEEAEILELAGQSASNAGQHQHAERLLRRSLAVRQAQGDPQRVSRAIAALGEALLIGARVDAAIELLEEAMPAAADLSSIPEAIPIGAQLARGLLMSSKPTECVNVAERVLAAAEATDMPLIVADTLITKGSALADLGRSYEGVGAMRAGLELARFGDNPRTELRALINMSATLIPLDPAAGVEVCRQGIAYARRMSLPGSVLLENGIEAAHSSGDWMWAFEEAQAALTTDMESSDRAFLMCAVLPIRSWLGEDVSEALAEAESLLVGFDDPEIVSNLLGARSHAALAVGHLDEARAYALDRAAASIYNAPSSYCLAARVALWKRDASAAASDLALLDATRAHGPAITLQKATIRAGIAALEGSTAEALAGYRNALQGWRDAGLPVLEALTAIDMATLLDQELPEVQAAAANAREILGRLGAQPFIDRLERALAPSVSGPRPRVDDDAASVQASRT